MQFSYHMQHGPDPNYLRVLSTAKHVADYDQEGSPLGVMRGDFDAIVSDQDQVEYYLPAWRAAIKGGDIRSFMCRSAERQALPECVPCPS